MMEFIMGVDHSAYIGPYLRVTEKLEKKSEDLCADHNRPEDALFCPKCGRSTKDRIRTYDDGPAPRGWQEELPKDGKKVNLYDYLWPCFTKDVNKPGTSTAIYLPNRYYAEIGIPKIDGRKYSEEDVPFDDMNGPVITQKFLEKFKDEIAYLKQWFEVEVKFGYVAYCS
jgi:hypothetical protein